MDRVSYAAGGRDILTDVTLDVLPGQVTALVGPNGAGKSSLLGLLTGDLTPTSGSVRLHGRELARWDPPELARARSVLLQSNQVAFPFTVRDVVEMGRRPWHRTSQAAYDETAVGEALQATETEQFAGRSFPTLSGGEQARVSLARVLAQRSPVVLLDEPTAALDIYHQEQVMDIVRGLAASGSAVVVVLHDLTLAAAHADEVIVLDAGRVVGSGTPEEVLTVELLEQVYRTGLRVVPDPDTGLPVVLPRRRARAAYLP